MRTKGNHNKRKHKNIGHVVVTFVDKDKKLPGSKLWINFSYTQTV